jgi:adenylosuccinate synthase
MARGNGQEIDRAWNHRWNIEQDRWNIEQEGVFIIKHRDWRTLILSCREILLEGSQGWSLSLNGPFYPYVTTRDCTPARFMSDAMVPLNLLNKVYGVMRVFPIRVGGDSGGWYPGQMELTWDELGLDAEYTTTTKKIRRVATFSHEQIEEAFFHCSPDFTILTHCDQSPSSADDIIKWQMERYGTQPLLTTWGPSVFDVKQDYEVGDAA